MYLPLTKLLLLLLLYILTTTTTTIDPQQASIDLISLKGERAYDERIRAWRLKRIEAYTHSHIKWAFQQSNSIENDADLSETNRMNSDYKVRKVMV